MPPTSNLLKLLCFLSLGTLNKHLRPFSLKSDQLVQYFYGVPRVCHHVLTMFYPLGLQGRHMTENYEIHFDIKASQNLKDTCFHKIRENSHCNHVMSVNLLHLLLFTNAKNNLTDNYITHEILNIFLYNNLFSFSLE